MSETREQFRVVWKRTGYNEHRADFYATRRLAKQKLDVVMVPQTLPGFEIEYARIERRTVTTSDWEEVSG